MLKGFRDFILRGKWSLYHAGVLLLLYSDLMILTLIVFLVAYPL